MGYAQLVIGPAGSGKSTYCSSLYQHCETVGRTIHMVNLDPAAEHFSYPVSTDIRELISLDDVMEELGMGPNGGLIYCMDDVTKYISGCMASLSAMIQLELPHINILSKMDLVSNKKDVEEYLNPEAQVLLSQLNRQMVPKFGKLNKSLAELVDDYSMVNFIPLDLRKESSIQYVLSHIDNCIQYGEDADVKLWREGSVGMATVLPGGGQRARGLVVNYLLLKHANSIM
uniref:GPN-loop GTPase 3 n=1 Tax=Oryza punctata TaxID=4537 RepID=A0A0E0KDH0_ORYPU